MYNNIEENIIMDSILSTPDWLFWRKKLIAHLSQNWSNISGAKCCFYFFRSFFWHPARGSVGYIILRRSKLLSFLVYFLHHDLWHCVRQCHKSRGVNCLISFATSYATFFLWDKLFRRLLTIPIVWSNEFFRMYQVQCLGILTTTQLKKYSKDILLLLLSFFLICCK